MSTGTDDADPALHRRVGRLRRKTGADLSEGTTVDQDKEAKIKARAYEIWEEEGRPEGQHGDHWIRAEQHVGMMGDGTEEQNLNQTGNPAARISKAEVEAAFGQGSKTP